MEKDITLTDVESWISQYPDLWSIYSHNRDLLLSYYDDTLSTEFQVLAEINQKFWELATANIKVLRKLDEINKE